MSKFTAPGMPVLCRAAVILFLILVLAICSPAGLYFLSDDFAHVPHSHAGRFFHNHLLRPFQWVTLWVDSKLWGVEPEGYHFTNLCIHLVNTALFFLLAWTLCRRYAPPTSRVGTIAVLGSLLFLCYGNHSEPVFWILGRGGSLAACFIQLSILCYLKGGLWYRLLGVLSFGIGLFTYELTWILPLLLTAFYLYERYHQKRLSPYLPITLYWNVLTLYLFYRYFVLRGTLNGYATDELFHLNFAALAHKWVALIGRVFLPPMEHSSFFIAGVVVVGIIFLTALFLLFRQSRGAFAFSLLLIVCIAICLLPVASLGIDTHDTEGERVVYPATLFACLLILFLATCLLRKRATFNVFTACLLLFHTYYLYESSLAYRYASYVSRFTIESLNAVPGAKSLTLTNIPAQYKGALLFRIGFPIWAPGILATDYEGVQIKSVRELEAPRRYQRIIRPSAPYQQHLQVVFTNDTLILY